MRVDLAPPGIARIEVVPWRHRRIAGEGPVFVEQIPAAAHDHQQIFDGGIVGGAVQLEPGLVALPPVDIVEQAAGLDEFVHHLPFFGGEAGGMERHIHAFPARQPLLRSRRRRGVNLREREHGSRGQRQEQEDPSHAPIVARQAQAVISEEFLSSHVADVAKLADALDLGSNPMV